MTEQEAQQLIAENVPRETFEKLELFVNLLIEWQPRLNLVSRGTIPQVWVRHVYDSFQLKNHIPDAQDIIVDFGSGAGFPGMVLAILGYNIFLVESNAKKVSFLNTVKQRLDLKNKIIHDRFENQYFKKMTVFTSRAVAHLDQLLSWVYPSFQDNSTAVFMKGQNYQAEIQLAKKNWNFDCVPRESLTQKDSMILIIKNIKKRH